MEEDKSYVLACLSGRNNSPCTACSHYNGDFEDCQQFILVFCDHGSSGKTVAKASLESFCPLFHPDAIESLIVPTSETKQYVN
jgi:hypothetical protein